MRQVFALLIVAFSSLSYADSSVEKATAPKSPSLPAGVWFRGHEYSTCEDCETPTAAWVAGPFSSLAAAQKAVAAAPNLPLGYPLVVHTDELGLVDATEGVVVVYGLYAQASDATATPNTRILPLLDRMPAFERRMAKHPEGIDDTTQRIIRIQAGAPVPAFSSAQIDARSELEMDTREVLGRGHYRQVCSVDGGAIFLAAHSALRHVYQFAEVRCPDGTPAMVRWRDTLLSATIFPDGNLRQTTNAECDSPTFHEWKYSKRGRSPGRGRRVVGTGGGGC